MFPGKCAKIPTFFSQNHSKKMKTNIVITQQTMTSLEIAELTGKQHKHVMEAIRKMEPAWVCLYIATKFNDEARAKLVLRWQELEMADVRGKMADVRGKMAEGRCLPEPKKILALADEIIGDGLRLLNAGAEDTLTATQVAKTFNMTVYDFNCVLRDMGIQYRRYGRWNISDDLVARDLVRQRTHVSYSLKGEKKVRTYMTWTMNGLRFLNAKLGYPNF